MKETQNYNYPPELKDPIETLSLADPELSREVLYRLNKNHKQQFTVSAKDLVLLLEDTFWGLEREVSFGRAIATGFAELLGRGCVKKVPTFRKMVYESGETGPTLGRLMAEHLPPVLIHGSEDLLKHFTLAVNTMAAKGTYTLKTPLQVLSGLLNSEETDSAEAFLMLLNDTFKKDLSYNQSLHFSYILPRAVKNFPEDKRHRLISVFSRVLNADFLLAESFLEGLDKGLCHLSHSSLERFVSKGLEKLKISRQMAAKFLSLESRLDRKSVV